MAEPTRPASSVALPEPEPHPELDLLIAVSARLRAPGGCA